MKRTNKEKRKENARMWHQIFMQSNSSKSAIVVERTQSSTNPHISRCKFLAVPSSLAFMEEPVVIAESLRGIEGCFCELLDFIQPCPQKTYYEDGFNEWLRKTFHFEITYKDGLVFMLERTGGR